MSRHPTLYSHPVVHRPMAYRRFQDQDGRAWEVWAVPPTHGERRGADRRRLQAPPPSGVERRRGGDRRVVRQTRVRLSDEFQDGWLTFECPPERRRLAPVPPAWEHLDEPQLAALCQRARKVG